MTQLNLPSTAERGGDFSALCTVFNSSGVCTTGTQLYNPFTGQPFANNQIPSSLIASQATTLMPFLPAPTIANTPGLPNETANYTSTDSTTANIDGAELRVDRDVAARIRG